MAKKNRQLPPSPFADLLLLSAEFTLLAQLFATAIIFNGYFTNPLINKFLMAQGFTAIAWSLYLIHCFFSRAITIGWSPYYIPAALLAFWACIRAFTSPDAMALWYFYTFFTILLAFPLWVTLFQTKRFQRHFLQTVIVTGSIVLLGCLRQLWYHLTKEAEVGSIKFFDWKILTLTSGSYDRQFLGSFLGHNNHSTAYLVIVSILAVYMLYRSWKSNWWIAYSVLLCLSFLCILYGGSRSAFLMIPPAIFLMAYGFYKQFKTKTQNAFSMSAAVKPLLYGLGGVVVVLIAAVFLINTVAGGQVDSVFARFGTSVDELLSGTYPRVWLLSLYMFYKNPLTGIGFGAWSHQYPYYQESWFGTHPDTGIGLPEIGRHTEKAHNDYFQLIAELGLPGLIIMLWLFVIHFRFIGQLFRQAKPSMLAVTAAACTIATLVQTAFAFPFYVAPNACLFLANLALFACLSQPKIMLWKPAMFQSPVNAARWGMSALVLILSGILLYPVGVFTKGDFTARQKDTYLAGAYSSMDQAYQALARGDNDTYQEELYNYNWYYDEGLKHLGMSFNYLPNRGSKLYNYGIEILGKGISENDPEIIQTSIQYFQKSLDSYVFYDTFTHLGRAYRALWEMENDPEYKEQALNNFQRAVSIMPTFYQGWFNYTSFLGQTGDQKKAINILAEMELRYPGLIEEGVYPAVESATQEKNIERASMIYNLALAVTPSNEKLYQRVVSHYVRINRLDMAERMLVGTAHSQRDEIVMNETIKVLIPKLNSRHYFDAHKMMQDLLAYENLKDSGRLHYYAAVTAWLAGDAQDSFAHSCYGLAKGVPLKKLQQILNATAEVGRIPFEAAWLSNPVL